MKSPTVQLENVIVGDHGLAAALGMTYHATRLARWRGTLEISPIGKIGSTSLYDIAQVRAAADAYRRDHYRVRLVKD